MTFIMISLLQLLHAITFSLTVNKPHNLITLSYPEKVVWVRVCVESAGVKESFYHEYCWTPETPIEEFYLDAKTAHVRASLEIREGNRRSTLITPVWQVKE